MVLNRNYPEPEFVNILRSPGIDFQPGWPVRQPYLKYRSARLHKVAEGIPGGIDFPGFLRSLQIRALRVCLGWGWGGVGGGGQRLFNTKYIQF